MAISFVKYRRQIEEAWKDVLDDKSTTNWCLFGYEGQSNELKVVSHGNGGLLELNEDLNSGKIMYAFVRIEDPKTRLTKFLLINWQGEGAPVLRKGTCANHIHEVTKILSGAHLTVNARNEDDIDLERLQKKLNAAGLTYNFKENERRTCTQNNNSNNNNNNHNNNNKNHSNDNSCKSDAQKNVDIPSEIVGTNYKRVVPTKELNPTAMQDFWKKEEAEERNRLQNEKEQKRLQEIKLEQEQRAREEKEHLEREKKLQEEDTLNKLHSAHKPIKTSPQPLSPEKTLTKNYQNALTEAERMRQQRSQEARELIGSKVLTAKAIFTKNTTEGQLQAKLNTIVPPAKPVRNSITQRINAFNQSQADSAITNSINSNTNSVNINNSNNNTHYQHQQPNNPLIDDNMQQTHKFQNPIIGNTAFNVDDMKNNVPIIITTNEHAEPQIVTMNDDIEVKRAMVQEISEKMNINNGTGNERVEPVKPEIPNIHDNDNDDETLTDGTGIDDYYLDSNEVEQFSTIKRSPHSKTNSLQSPDELTSTTITTTKTALNTNININREYQTNNIDNKTNIEIDENHDEEENNDGNDDDGVLEVVRTKVSVTVQQSQSQTHPSLMGKNNGYFDDVLERNDLNNIINEDDYICQGTLADIGLRARALYDYQAADDSEITFDPGDIITHIDEIDEGWWQGYGPDGSYGLFPANYVKIIQ